MNNLHFISKINTNTHLSFRSYSQVNFQYQYWIHIINLFTHGGLNTPRPLPLHNTIQSSCQNNTWASSHMQHSTCNLPKLPFITCSYLGTIFCHISWNSHCGKLQYGIIFSICQIRICLLLFSVWNKSSRFVAGTVESYVCW